LFIIDQNPNQIIVITHTKIERGKAHEQPPFFGNKIYFDTKHPYYKTSIPQQQKLENSPD